MAEITKISSQKSGQRFNLYLDGKFALGLDADNLLKAGIAVGQELTEKQLKDLIFKSEFQKLLDKTLRLVSLRPRSEKEISTYLHKILLKKDTIVSPLGRNSKGEVIKRLKKLGYLDDEKFARWWLEQRETFRPRGKFGLKAELAQKGIGRGVIEKVLGGVDELALAKRAAAKKLKAYRRLSPREFRQKMSTFLSRQGFSWETIKMTIDQLGKKDYN